MAWYKNLGENATTGIASYQKYIIPRVKMEYIKQNTRDTSGNQNADAINITIEHRDTTIPAGFNSNNYEKDFIILYQGTAPANNLTPQTAIDAGLKPWSASSVKFITGITGRVDNTIITGA